MWWKTANVNNINNMYCNYCINTSKKAIYNITSNSGEVRGICKSCLNSTYLQKLYDRWAGSEIKYINDKRVNRYNLPINHKYKIQSFDYCGSILDGGGSTCDNCNRIIVNIANIQDVTSNRSYSVGLDCAETLSLVDTSDFWKVKEEEARARKILSWVRNVKNKQKAGIICKYQEWENCYTIHTGSVCWNYRVTKEVYQKYFNNLGLVELKK